MVIRIIRGALLGIVLGLLMGVGLSGSMYMFNYMKSGGDWENSSSIIANDEVVKGNNSSHGDSVPAVSVGNGIRRDYNSYQLSFTLHQKGINGLAQQVATDNWTSNSNNYVSEEAVSENAQEEENILGNSLIRFHVRANSNSDVDIALKYKVRDHVLYTLEDGLSKCTSTEEAQEYLAENLQLIKDVAQDTLSKEGFNYSVNAYLTNDYFPMRQYGEMVLPAGYYKALRIDIGLANGENFWCLLYPTMCVPIEAGGVITKEGQQELESSLTTEQYHKLFVKKQIPKENIEIRFKLWEMLFGED